MGEALCARTHVRILLLGAAVLFFYALTNPTFAADQPLPLKAHPLMPPVPRLPCSLGVMFGGVINSNTGVTSSSGFYQGGYGSFGAPYGGAFADCTVAKFGPPNMPYRSWTLGIDPVIDVTSASIKFSGTGGGFPVTSTGSLTQADLLVLLKLTTPLRPGFNLSLFGGLGVATLWRGGMPTGTGGPAFTDSSTTAAFRLGAELWEQVSDSLAIGLQLSYQHTNPVSFDTTLPGESFQFRGNDRVMLGFDFKFGDDGGKAPIPGGGYTQDAGDKGSTKTPPAPKSQSKDWSPTSKLTWNDFTGPRPPDAPTDEGAGIFSGYTEFACDCKGGKLVCTKKAHGYMEPSQSYVDADSKTDSMLKHEQGHFDIAELHARKLNKKLSETACKAGDNVQTLINDVVKGTNAELDKAQSDYDEKTDHGRDAKAQDQQSKEIQKQLDGLKDYKG